ncbi:MAG: hypothetical protein BWY01_01527 [Synergistetes bacterium ADurb.Bin155]|jgi:hypothetical protein|nr:KTSC domain-containing protein [Syntrophobacterales bacterium]OQB44956.1 MAG: hypothetical protein BWY01_01527 [Synergistetes bacterium ADurb.Bin155]
MNRTPVHPSNIRSIGYDAETRILEVEFHSGGICQYSGVPETVLQEFMRDASKRSYTRANTRDRYPDRRVQS